MSTKITIRGIDTFFNGKVVRVSDVIDYLVMTEKVNNLTRSQKELVDHMMTQFMRIKRGEV